MKLVNFHAADGIRAGLVRDGGVEDLAASGLWTGTLPVARAEIAALSARTTVAQSPLIALDSLRLAPVVVSPEKIICVGLNYRRHAVEAKMAIPTTPVIFGKFANSLSAHGDRVALPSVDDRYDYEAELAVVIGTAARDVSVADALTHVAGYCCANDLSARGAQLATSQWMIGKMLDGFLPLGPMLVTTDEIPDPQALQIKATVNGMVMQDSSTSDMIFSVAEIIAFLSRHATLKPGDVIVTGTPEGVQMGYATPTWLKPGDAVTIEISDLGRLTTVLTDGSATAG
ncbi:2-keto-4-pentenoate hydratase/2-oxohepta-3-ene-1,7-dioic acid hydratase (catechol pathway) [Loktanella fryxellensis]|uniref:2-keto-4-pentenoate hydratase/2-oxohepta-3-ene-1,7-dioic acid hydratase (Catechol pathway) n=1 Tax=Loktanella fryxellensis TaxID=245187 RepID=A0A1H8C5Z7_9RHOB|nr:fumarylacetoacetate hydrolase family protein [Loktanella fryxellensis]SEM90503.1 2-keto-4-pentenoate hydratase/2-oxohepta-3-ene-1,7-dioic acid hydratase (catechol pathway) [Loktanella fryxellensis]